MDPQLPNNQETTRFVYVSPSYSKVTTARKLLTTIGIVALVGTIGAGALYLFIRQQSTPATNATQIKLSPQSQQSLTTSDNLPLNFEHKGVSGGVILYTFEGVLVAIKPATNGAEFVLDISKDNVPKFILTSDTQFHRGNIGTRVNLVDFKIGQPISVLALYDLKLKKWITTDVIMATVEDAKQATSSPQDKSDSEPDTR